MGLTQATTYIDDATAYRMEVQGQDANVEYESNGTAPAEINPHWDTCNSEWEVSVNLNPSPEFAHPMALGSTSTNWMTWRKSPKNSSRY